MNTAANVSLKFHIPLLTGSKLFCSCPNGQGEPNANTCPVCMGAFGAVPALNRSAMLLGILVGISLNCSIGNKLIFDKMPCSARSMPKGFRMAQYTAPIARDGYINILSSGKKKRVDIRSCRLEEGYRTDEKDVHGKPDYNKCGTSVVTVETRPCLCSGDEVRETLQAVTSLLHFFGATEANYDSDNIIMELRIAADPQTAADGGTRLYLKGTALEAEYATDFEIGRQLGVIRSGYRVEGQTVAFDRETKTTVPSNGAGFCFESTGGAAMRDASITPAQIHELYMKAAASVIGELPSEKRRRYVTDYGVEDKFALKISSERPYSVLFEYCVAHCLNIRDCGRWIGEELDDILKIAGVPAYMLDMDCEKFAALMNMLGSRLINDNGCREILTQLLINGVDPFDYAVNMGLLLITDSETIIIACRVAMRQNTDALRAYLTGSTAAFDFLVDCACTQLNDKSDRETVCRYMQAEATCDFLAACDRGEIPPEAAVDSALNISVQAKAERLLELLDNIPDPQAQSILKSSRTLSRYEVELLVNDIVRRSYAEAEEMEAVQKTEVSPSLVDARPFFPETSPMSRYFLNLYSPMPEYDAYYDGQGVTGGGEDISDITKMIEDMDN